MAENAPWSESEDLRRWCPQNVLTVQVMPKTPIEETWSTSHWAPKPGERTVSTWWSALEFAALLHAESEVTNASAKRSKQLEAFPPFGAHAAETKLTPQQKRPSMQRASKSTSRPLSQKFLLEPLKECNRVVTVAIPESVTLRLKIASLKSMTIPKPVTCNRELVTDLEIVSCLCTWQGVGEHDYPQVSDVHWRFDVRQSFGNSLAFETATSKGQVLAKDRLSRKRRKCAIDDKLQVEGRHL